LAGRLACEFSLVRYVPDPVKNEFVNIGVVLRGQGAERRAEVRFTRDWSRVRCLDPDADTAMLEGLEEELRRCFALEGEGVMGGLEDALSNTVQLSESKGCLAESLPAEMELLMRLYVERRREKRAARKATGRAAVLARMRGEFERAGVWDLMAKRIAAGRYTRAGDPLRIDCGYRPNGVLRMFQAVSLEADAEAAKGLAFSAGELAAGVKRVEGAELELTAIVEPLRGSDGGMAGERDEGFVAQYRFGVEAMERERIRVLTMADLGRVAETARRELRV
jgi:hypothetical protein